MRFADGQEAFPNKAQSGQEDAFFITEDVRQGQTKSRTDMDQD